MPRSHPRRAWAVRLIALVVFSTAGAASAQPVPTEGVTVYRYVRPGEAVVQVGVWGSVRQPGLYDVAVGTGLRDLLSLAGGPDVGREEARVERVTFVEVVRGGADAVVFSSALDDLAGWSPPALADGDIVSVRQEVRERFGWRDALSVGTAVVTIAIFVLQSLR